VDYLLKPVKAEELKNAVQKFREFHRENKPVDNYLKLAQLITKNSVDYKERIVTRMGGLLKIVNISDVAYFYTENKITYACTKQHGTFAIDETLEELEGILNPRQFFRINRQFIVSIDSIDKMLIVSKSRVKLTLQPPSPLETIASTERSGQFKKWLGGEVIE